MSLYLRLQEEATIEENLYCIGNIDWAEGSIAVQGVLLDDLTIIGGEGW